MIVYCTVCIIHSKQDHHYIQHAGSNYKLHHPMDQTMADELKYQQMCRTYLL